MKAIVIEPNKDMVWKEVENPVLKCGEVLVEVRCAGVNRADLMQREGCYPPPPGCPDWPGLEISGVIKEMSIESEKESTWKVGDKVCALLGGGGYAQYAAVHHTMLMPIPEGISFEEAAALPEAFATAYLNLFIEGGAKKGQTFLMQAGKSGLASVVIPMAKAFGLRVITTVRTDEEVKAISHLNADVVVNTSKEKLCDVLKREEEAGHPLNLAIDCLGSENVGECFPYVAYGCRWIMIATLAGDISSVNMRTMYVKNIRLIGSTLRSKSVEVKGQILANLVGDIWPKVESGEVRPTIYEIMPITDAEKAHALLEEGKSAGKVILTMPKEN
ncbi:MAG: NAD(P)H-quinone oxidoreductase [Clostridia bacterium]|nr:NAD(P)H-quinone oxidoreductase [Clostridia bacterium]